MPGYEGQAAATVHVLAFGEVRPGKAAVQWRGLLHMDGILPCERASSSQTTSPGKSLPKPALSKEERLRAGASPAASSFFPLSPSKLAPTPLISSSSEIHCGENLDGGRSELGPTPDASRRPISV